MAGQMPLEDVRVLDMGQIYQGPYCGMILSNLGAEVVKVEPPYGENVRFRSDDSEGPEVQMLNPNKQGIELDLKHEEGKAILKDLVEISDVLIENFSQGTMESLGLGYDTLREINPELIYAHGSGYGDSGPRANHPAMDLTMQAVGGIIHTTGFPDGPPVKTGAGIADFLGGIHLATGITSALYRREQTGEGDYVEVGMYDCLYPTLTSPLASWVRDDGTPPRTGNRHSGLAVAPYNVYEASDGYVSLLCINDAQWSRLVEVMGAEEETEEYELATQFHRAKHIDMIDELVQDWMDGQTKDEAVDTLLDNEIPCAPVQTIDEIVNDEHLAHREMVNMRANKGEGRDDVPVPGMPIKFKNSPDPEISESPRVGEHSEDVLRSDLEYDQDHIDSLREDGVINKSEIS